MNYRNPSSMRIPLSLGVLCCALALSGTLARAANVSAATTTQKPVIAPFVAPATQPALSPVDGNMKM
jgi:hypothetical protein